MSKKPFAFLSFRVAATFAVAALACWISTVAAAGERIVVIGDSITGHSLNLEYGYAHEIRAAFAASGLDDEFVPLGGSGQTIISWQGILKNSYENDFRLDIPNIRVKTELDLGADVVLVHLGMNDALQPSFVADDAGYAVWKAEYVRFLDEVKRRVPSKRLIVTPPTMLTETPFAFKNLAMDKLATLAQEAATEAGVEFYDARAEFKKFFENARMLDQNVRFTLDFVHPNKLGHQVMTYSFLKALGRDAVAEKYRAEKMDAKILDFDAPGLALFVVPTDSADKVVVKGRLRGAAQDSLEVVPPQGLQLDEIVFDAAADNENGAAFEIRLSGKTPELSADLVVKAGADLTRTVKINAPYFVAAGFPMKAYPYPGVDKFPRADAKTAIDDVVLAGKDPVETPIEIDGKPVVWTVARATVDETGFQNPNAVDLANFGPASAFDAAYVVRRVYSPKAQTVALKMNAEGFSPTTMNTVYLNGKEIYFDCLSPRHVKAKDEISVELKEGVNVLVARVDHTHWQWAISFAFEGEGLTY